MRSSSSSSSGGGGSYGSYGNHKNGVRGVVLVTIAMVVLVLLNVPVEGVDRSKFKRCDDSAFCKRQRSSTTTSDLSDSSSPSSEYGVDVTTSKGILVVGKQFDTFEVPLVNSGVSNYEGLLLQVSGYKNNIVRMKINEKNPLRPRYEVKDVLLSSELSENAVPIKITATSADETTLELQGTEIATKVKIQHSPLKVDVFQGDQLLISANARGLLNFEHYRQKSTGTYKVEDAIPSEQEQPDRQPDGDVIMGDDGLQAQVQKEVVGAWEESFGSHRDTKPYGPSSVGLDFTFFGAEQVYGIPEHASDLALKPTMGPNIKSDPYRLYNLDVFEYELDNPMALYGSVPFMLAHGKQTTGLFWMNAAETWIDVSRSSNENTETHWFSESGVIDVFFLLGPKPYSIFSQYSSLTGTIPLPPLFSIAYHQCRWNYKDEADVKKVDNSFDEYDIPYDVIWLDIEHTESKKYFTWDKTHFPTPEVMQRDIAAKHRKMVTIVDPHIKRDAGYYIHTEASSKGLYVKNNEGKDYDGWCWPGSSSWLDFTDPEIRSWWAEKFSYSSYKGSSDILFTWNDMNEPSVFNGPEVTMHKDAKHYGNVEHRDIHNMYGFYMHMATYQGLSERNPDQKERPFLLTRAFYAGSQRYGAVWTGDNAAQWSHLAVAQPMLLSLGLSGITFSGADVGGFFGNPDGELITRWYQAGAFHPFFRGHAHLDTKRREPWLFGEPYTSHIRSAIRTRYALLPYWYTTFRNSSLTGIPIIRPLWVEYPSDRETFTLQDQFLAGPSILVKPVVTSQQTSTQVYLPGNELWYEYAGKAVHQGPKTVTVSTPLDKIPVFLKGGSIIPKKERSRRSSALMVKDPYTLIVSLDLKGQAFGSLYIDDGHSTDFKKQVYVEREFSFENNQLKSVGVNRFPISNVIERIVVNGVSSKPNSIQLKVNGKPARDLGFEFDAYNKILVIRKPDVPVVDDFVIEFH